jgi:very-short-patch-repair endonuclease
MDGSRGEPAKLKLEEELRFHPVRRWRFDFAHIEALVAIEIEGGTWVGGRHTRPAGFHKDCEKYNEATLCGWTIFRLTHQMINGEFIERIQDFILERLEQKKTKKQKKNDSGK